MTDQKTTETPLPPFSGDNPTCPKCRHVGAYTRYYNPAGRGWVDYQHPAGPRVTVEHLERECERCGYSWPEALAPHSATAPTTTEPCPFCDIIAGLAAADVVRTWPDAIAFTPLSPVTTGHVLVVPREHVPDFAASPAVSAIAMSLAAELADGMGPVNLITSRGAEATQTVRHLHLHLVPRREDDGLLLPWSSR